MPASGEGERVPRKKLTIVYLLSPSLQVGICKQSIAYTNSHSKQRKQLKSPSHAGNVERVTTQVAKGSRCNYQGLELSVGVEMLGETH